MWVHSISKILQKHTGKQGNSQSKLLKQQMAQLGLKRIEMLVSFLQNIQQERLIS